MSIIANRNREQESAMLISAMRRYCWESSLYPRSGVDSSLLEALNAYFLDRTET